MCLTTFLMEKRERNVPVPTHQECVNLMSCSTFSMIDRERCTLSSRTIMEATRKSR